MDLSRKSILTIIITTVVIILIISSALIIVNKNFIKDSNDMLTLNSKNVDEVANVSLPDGPTASANIYTSGVNSQLIGSDEKGTVELLGPFGNTSSNIKIAYLTGMHPLESKVHKALFDSLKAKNSSLKYCYYVYRTNVTLNPEDGSEGRMNGQLLAQKYVAPDVTSKNYTFVVDVHGNQGLVGGSYEETNFVFAPANDEKSIKFANTLISQINGICSYVPKDQSSPPFITIPIAESGIPVVIYESYSYEPYNKTVSLIFDLIDSVDNLSF